MTVNFSFFVVQSYIDNTIKVKPHVDMETMNSILGKHK